MPRLNIQESFLAAVACGLTTFLIAPAAFACGGFFCSSGAPVAQAEEEVLFVVDDGRIDAHVRVEYQGTSDDFVWIVPVPSLPEVGLSADSIFARLDERTAPQFNVDYKQAGFCDGDLPGSEFSCSGTQEGGDYNEDVDAPEWTRDVDSDDGTAVETGRVGPYDYAVLQHDNEAAVVQWLLSNGYDVPDTAAPIFRYYIETCPDMHFVAFRLSPDSQVGDIQPIRLRYHADEPVLPIRLTALATVPVLGITAYVLGEARAVPENYRHVDLNEARFDWFRFDPTVYDFVVTQAVDDAGSHAFVTEFANETHLFDGVFWDEETADALAHVRDAGAFIMAAETLGLPLDAQLEAILADNLAIDGSVVGFLDCPECLSDWEIEIDAASAVERIEREILQPLRDLQEQFDRLPYLTRMYTNLSAEEMNVDPEWTFNHGMPNVSNEHNAEGFLDCISEDQTVRLTLPNGRLIVTDEQNDLFGLTDLPPAELIQQTRATGPPAMIQDNNLQIDLQLADWNGQFGLATPYSPFGSSLGEQAATIGTGACSSMTTVFRIPAGFALALGAILVARVRRRGDEE